MSGLEGRMDSLDKHVRNHVQHKLEDMDERLNGLPTLEQIRGRF